MAAEQPARGWVEPALAEEFPHLGVHWTAVEAPRGLALAGRSPEPVRERLRVMSNRFSGPRAVNLRQEAVPAAYRIFFRQIGIDPDRERTPPEQAALQRMHDGAFKSHGLLDDALTIATVETGVGVLAVDAAAVSGEPGLRLAREGEQLGAGSDRRPLAPGRIVVADRERPLGLLFGHVAADCEPSRRTRRAVLVAVRVAGVPEISAEEALWTAAETVAGEAS